MVRALRWARWVLENAPQLARTVPRNPSGALRWAREELHMRRESLRPRYPYRVDPDWERQLHEWLGAPWPCPETHAFRELWPRVLAPFEAKGARIGRGAFGGWGDGEPGLARAAWCLVRHRRPAKVVETGVARGFTSRIILEALDRNGNGRLWSIDLPPVDSAQLHAEIGAAVPSDLRARWTYVEGTSRQRLPGVLSQLGGIDLFIHDSRHTEENVNFELAQAWAALTNDGAALVDDVDLNWGLHSFLEAHAGIGALICHGEPLVPDPKRTDDKGLFAIVPKCAPGIGVSRGIELPPP
jgi:hypothetical protein